MRASTTSGRSQIATTLSGDSVIFELFFLDNCQTDFPTGQLWKEGFKRFGFAMFAPNLGKVGYVQMGRVSSSDDERRRRLSHNPTNWWAFLPHPTTNTAGLSKSVYKNVQITNIIIVTSYASLIRALSHFKPATE